MSYFQRFAFLLTLGNFSLFWNPSPSRTSTWAIFWAEKGYLSPSTPSPRPQHLAEGPLEHPVRGGLIDWYLDVLGTVPIFRETGVGTSEFKGRYILFAGEREGTFFIFRALFEISKGFQRAIF